MWRIIAIIGVVMLSACRSEQPLVKIGLVAPFEGRYREVGYDAIYAARLAVRELNAGAGARGVRVELVALDDSSDIELARQAAASLVVDADVVAVVGHWREATTTAALPIYLENELPFIAAGQAPFENVNADGLPPEFLERYADVTPFDETAGAYAGPTYDAFQLLFKALELAESNGNLSRESVAASLEGLQYEGMTGTVYQPSPPGK